MSLAETLSRCDTLAFITACAVVAEAQRRDRDAARSAETACPARVPERTGKPGPEGDRP